MFFFFFIVYDCYMNVSYSQQLGTSFEPIENQTTYLHNLISIDENIIFKLYHQYYVDFKD